MAINLEQAFGVDATALKLREKRAEIIANNIANSDTPGFKARDIDFAQTFEQQLALANTADGETELELKYRLPLENKLDGNTVDMQLETSAFTENAVRYQASLTFLNQRIHNIMTALKGE